ncbi:MAG: hypothetical protein Q9226_003352 [Calogaya cf. arnoldii]
MHYLKLVIGLTALISSTSATCFNSGAPWASTSLAKEKLRDACNELDGTYDAGEVYSVCRDTPLQKYIFEVRNQSGDARSLSYEACVKNPGRQIDNCARGGYETFGGVRFKAKEMSGEHAAASTGTLKGCSRSASETSNLNQPSPVLDVVDGLAQHNIKARDDESFTSAEQRPSPIYHSSVGHLDFHDQGFDTQARLLDDGRLNIDITQRSQLSNLLASALEQSTDLPSEAPPSYNSLTGQIAPPTLNVVIQVVGSRGDVQPFVALGRTLKENHGHRVRLATHATFKNFVQDNGLEFFNIGGDPAELMAFMVKNPGLLPGMDSIRSGDVGKRRKGMYEIFLGCWRSCIELGDGTDSDDPSARPFVADAIIANPPSFAHIHCAEKLGIPLHLMFTTLKYAMVCNRGVPTSNRQHTILKLGSQTDQFYLLRSSRDDDLARSWRPHQPLQTQDFRLGFGESAKGARDGSSVTDTIFLLLDYCTLRNGLLTSEPRSPALIPKPNDWGPHIDIVGFYFLSLAGSFTPPSDLKEFLNAGPPPVYIGFGSIVIDDPNGMTNLIFEAVKKTGQRALVSKGWGGLGADELGVPEGVFMLGNVPHDWLFEHVSCVVHHGGAGTTAAGIAAGKPTVVVLFFGDQPFWGAMIARAKAGPAPIPYKKLTTEDLAAGILTCLEPRTVERAKELGAKIGSEKGTIVGAESFHRNLDVDALRCAICPGRAAVWRIRKTSIRLSAFAATTLCNEEHLSLDDLKLYRPKEYLLDDGPSDPVTASIVAGFGLIETGIKGVADLHKDTYRAVRSKTDRPNPATAQEIGNEQAFAIASPESISIEANSSLEPPSLSSTGTAAQTREDSGSQLFLNAASVAGKKTAGTGLKILTDILLNLARGFHNAPKLYNDRSVRQADKVTGLQSGLKAAGKGFTLGLYDGYSGMFTQPIVGAMEGGVTGFMKGIGKGLGGFFLKPSAAACALPGYALQGIYKELRNTLGPGTENAIIAARTAQGLDDWNSSTREEQMEVFQREPKGLKAKLQTQMQSMTRYGEKKKPQVAGKDGERQTQIPHAGFSERPELPDSGTDDVDFEAAIQQAVAARRQATSAMEEQRMEDAPYPAAAEK